MLVHDDDAHGFQPAGDDLGQYLDCGSVLLGSVQAVFGDEPSPPDTGGG